MEQQTLALIGYGRMGKLIEQLAPEYGFRIAARLGARENTEQRGIEELQAVDAAVEFSSPEGAAENLKALAKRKIPAVCGTTGWLKELDNVSSVVRAENAALVWSPNFSVGVAVFKRLAATAAELLKDRPEYGAWAWEIHHSAKKDAPSGTLLQLVEAMRQNGYGPAIDVSSSRAGKHPGTHEIGFDSAADTITLRHTARSREGFARGALVAARWILGRTGVYTLDDVLFGTERP